MKKNVLKISVILGILFFHSSFLQGQESLSIFTQTQVMPSTTVPIVEKSQMVAVLSSNQKITLSSFTLPELSDFNIIKTELFPPQKNSEGKFESKFVIDFMPLSLGELTFPSLLIPYKTQQNKEGVSQTPPVKITVVNTIGATTDPQMLRDIKDPVDAGINLRMWGILVLIAFVLGAGWFILKRRKIINETSSIPAEPSRPPDQVALEKLETLIENFKKTGDVKIFHIELSNIYREYLSGVYFIDTLEKTTTEIFQGMRKNNIDRKICLEVKEILTNSDLVKFAKFIPSEKQIYLDFNAVKSFIEKQRMNN